MAPAPPPVRSAISTYRPIYFIAGVDDSPLASDYTVKFQLSLKFETGLDNLFLAYTQRSYWDITSASFPFVDTSFMPEVFYVVDRTGGGTAPRRVPTVRVGFLHESNGKAGADNRAWDRLYAEPTVAFGRFFVTPTVWWIVSKADENGDIARYAGYGELALGYRSASGRRVVVSGRAGAAGGSVQADLSVPIQSFRALRNVPVRTRFYLQGWYGYGECLLGYDVRSAALRAGLEFTP